MALPPPWARSSTLCAGAARADPTVAIESAQLRQRLRHRRGPPILLGHGDRESGPAFRGRLRVQIADAYGATAGSMDDGRRSSPRVAA